ncbi:hypothetical protein [Reyranella sp.]|uniref:hypothetical protein n=1 Tax=Reyranella sp. TaxID=1929291 RepID=UPI0025FD11FC|nr:hypothetical protein [Reyranella sp.]
MAVFALSLSACSRDYIFEGNEYSNPMTVNRIKRLYEARDACLAKNAVPADATNSDVASIAKAVSLSCAPETDRLIIASNPDRDPKVAMAIRNDTDQRATLYVMRAQR